MFSVSPTQPLYEFLETLHSSTSLLTEHLMNQSSAVFFSVSVCHRLDFCLTEDEHSNTLVLDLAVYR